MNQKDYQLIARVIYDERKVLLEKAPLGPWREGALQGNADIATVLSIELARDNPRFDRELFLRSCRV